MPVATDPAAQGYARTEFSPFIERCLADHLAVISANGVQRKGSGEQLQRSGATYTLRRVAGDWRIVVAAIHDPLEPEQTPSQATLVQSEQCRFAAE